MGKITGQAVTVENNIPVGVLRIPTTVVLAFTGTSARVALTSTVRVVSVVATEDCVIKQGTVAVVAAANTIDNILLLRGQVLTFEVESTTTYIAAIRLTTSGTLYILEHAKVRT